MGFETKCTTMLEIQRLCNKSNEIHHGTLWPLALAIQSPPPGASAIREWRCQRAYLKERQLPSVRNGHDMDMIYFFPSDV
eukprot:3244328-Amphidinium_carterae.1